jgi:hypothetical protein
MEGDDEVDARIRNNGTNRPGYRKIMELTVWRMAKNIERFSGITNH